MKIGIVGAGLVGATAGYALLMRGVGSEIILVDLNRGRAEAEAADIYHAAPFAYPLRVRAGDYKALAGCRVVIVAAGVSQRPGESRLELLERNAAVFRSVIPAVLDHAPEAILVIASNPVDIMTHLAAGFARNCGVTPGRVFGSGTTLDTARFRALLGQHVGVNPQHVHTYVIGEHGDSEVLTWSLARIGGMTLDDFCQMRQVPLNDQVRADIDARVRGAAYTMIEGKGATYYGIGSALARIVEVILQDERAVLTVCAPTPGVEGIADVTLALPRLVGGEGIMATLPLSLSMAEHSALRRSAEIIRHSIEELEQVS